MTLDAYITRMRAQLERARVEVERASAALTRAERWEGKSWECFDRATRERDRRERLAALAEGLSAEYQELARARAIIARHRVQRLEIQAKRSTLRVERARAWHARAQARLRTLEYELSLL